MAKQRLEKYWKKTLKNYGWWHLKLQVIPFCHATMPSDFIAIHNDKIFLFECKQITITEKCSRFYLNRLSQYNDLLEFQNYSEINNSYVILLFWRNTFKKSTVKIIPIRLIEFFKENNIKSIAGDSYNELNRNVLKGGIIDITQLPI